MGIKWKFNGERGWYWITYYADREKEIAFFDGEGWWFAGSDTFEKHSKNITVHNKVLE